MRSAQTVENQLRFAKRFVLTYTVLFVFVLLHNYYDSYIVNGYPVNKIVTEPRAITFHHFSVYTLILPTLRLHLCGYKT